MAPTYDKGRTLSAQALFLAGFVLLVTTLPAQHWSKEQVVELYRSRWQIQILSTRADILPPEYIAELARLQDQAPSVE